MKNFKELVKQHKEASASSPWMSYVQAYKNAEEKALEEKGFPTSRDEKWRYTNIKKLLEKDFNRTSSVSLDVEPFIDKEDQLRYIFNNGDFIEGQSLKIIHEGVFACPFSQLNEEVLKTIGWSFDKIIKLYSDNSDHGFKNVNSILSTDGLFVHLNKGVQLKEVLNIYELSSGGSTCVSKSLIVLEEDAELTICEIHRGKGSNFKSKSVDIYLGENAVLNQLCIQSEDRKSYHLSNSVVKLKQSAKINSFFLSMGAEFSRQEIEVIHQGEKAEAYVHGSYLSKEEQQTAIFSKMSHMKPEGISEQSFKGIAADSSRVVFNGSVYIAQDAQKVDSDQQNKSLIFGHSAEVDSKPELEVYADDVKATHGATIGQLNESELFYLQSRAISKERATKLLSQAFVQANLDLISHDRLKNKAQAYLSREIEGFFVSYD